MRKRWDNAKIRQEILNTISTLGIERMPSRTEMDLITGNTALSNKVMKTGGIRYWANELGLELKNSETVLGNNYEFEAKNILENKGYKVDKMSTGHPYDLLANDYIKIDVKVSHYYHSDEFVYHTFGLGKKHHNCDIFICICLDDSDNVIKTLIIPSKYLMGIRQLSVGINSKYDKYNEAWEYIDKYDKFYKEIL